MSKPHAQKRACFNYFSFLVDAVSCNNNNQIIKKKNVQKLGLGKSMSGSLEDVKHEIAIMKKLNHPHVLRLYEVRATTLRIKYVLLPLFDGLGRYQHFFTQHNTHIHLPN